MGFPIRGARGAPLASARVIPVWLVCLLVKAACAMTRCVQVGRLGVSWDPGLVSPVQRWAMMRLKMRMRMSVKKKKKMMMMMMRMMVMMMMLMMMMTTVVVMMVMTRVWGLV